MTSSESPNGHSPETTEAPLLLFTQAGMARLLGISKQRIGQLKSEGALPEPTALIDGQHPVWSAARALEWDIGRTTIRGGATSEIELNETPD